MTHSEGTGKIALALSKAQGAIEGASKDANNPHFKSPYATLASIVGASQKPLADNEIAVVQSSSADANLVRMTTMLLHSSGEWLQSDVLQVQARDANPQAVGSCLTYLRRYQLAAMVGVAPIDDDAEAAEGRNSAQDDLQIPAKLPTHTITWKPITWNGETGKTIDRSEWPDDGPDLAVDLPTGFALIDHYKPDGDWHKFLWKRDASDGAMEYKTRLGHIAEPAIDAFKARVPVKLHSKKLPFLDRVEVLGEA